MQVHVSAHSASLCDHSECIQNVPHITQREKKFNEICFRFANIVSTGNKSEHVRLFSNYSDFCAFVETKDDGTFPDNIFDDLRKFNVFRKPRNLQGGEVAIIVKRTLKHSRRTDLETNELEFMIVECKALELYFGVFYGPPNKI